VVLDVGTGQPISFATVFAHSPTLRHETNATSSGDGSYRLSDLSPGTYRVTARYSTFTAKYDGVVVRSGRETTLDIRLLATSNASGQSSGGQAAAHSSNASSANADGVIQGSVIDGASGESLPGAVVAATSPHLSDARMAMADDKGGFRLLGLPPGNYTLSVYYHLIERGNIEVRKTNVQLHAGETLRVDLELDARPYD